MITIGNMTVIGFPAKTMIQKVGADNSNYCRNYKYKRGIGKNNKLVDGE